jgi:hypothetical protein
MVGAGPVMAQSSTASLFTIANYPVEARAADAVAAKSRAITDGQRAAFRSLVKRLVPVSAYRHVNRVTASANPATLVESFSVRSERNSSTDYIASLDFRFQAEAVKALLDREGLPYVERQAPAITVVPVWIAPADAATAPAVFTAARGSRAWSEAWRGLDLTYTPTPVKLEVAKPDLQAPVLAALAATDAAQWRIFAGAYPGAGDRLVAAIAQPDVAARRLAVTLIGYDATGAISWRKPYRVDMSDAGYAIELAAVVSLGVLEGRWKVQTVRGSVATPVSPAAGAGLPWAVGTPSPTAADPATPAGGPLQASVEFRSMGEWQDISRRLSSTPGVSNVDVLGLSGRAARVTFAFAGSREQLALAVEGQGLQVRQSGSGYVFSLP